jgi:bifunctional NMN adenylyltransferase/nudix hydrolase
MEVTMKQIHADVGIIVGRFQVNELHKAHLDLIQTVVDQHAKVIIFLGLSPVISTENNPLDFEARKQMIQEKFSDINILYIADMNSDKEWSKKLDNQISELCGPGKTAALYGGRSSFIDHYEGKYICIELKDKQTQFISGAVIRKNISNKVKSSADFRAGVIWSTANRYANAIPTVDVAILSEDGKSVLLARKKYESMYRFIGGFTDAGETYEAAARREVMEETTLSISDPKYIASFVIDDWRYRNEKSKITTLFFEAKFISGKPEARDDIEELRWFELNKKLKEYIIDTHLPLYEKLSFLSYFK